MFKRRTSLRDDSSDDEMEPPSSIRPDRRISVSAESIDPTADQDSDKVRHLSFSNSENISSLILLPLFLLTLFLLLLLLGLIGFL